MELFNWLRDVATQLGDFVASQLEAQIYLNFLIEVLEAISDSNDNPQTVYPILQQNIDKLNENFAQFLRNWASEVLSLNSDTTQSIASNIGNFSNLVQQFPQGSIAANYEIAIAGYESIQAVFTRRKSPKDWALAQNNLATAYRDRIRGDRGENLEQAIAAYQAALTVRTQSAFPQEWADTQNSLAIAYGDRIRGDREENLEFAIAAYQAALTVRTQSAFPQDWAMIQNNLALAYRNRIRGDREENLEFAIAAYQAALTVRTQSAFPEKWAMIQNNLASAYRNRIRGDREENLEFAIAASQAALTVRTQSAFPQEWAATQNSLANAYTERIRGDRGENLEFAIAAYQAALTVRTQSAFPQDWAMTQNNLALAYRHRIRGDRGENLEQAIAACEAAFTVYTPSAYPIDCLRTGRNLGILGLRENLWDKAIFGYDAAIQAVEQSLEWVTSEKRKRELRESALDVYEDMVRVCINDKQMDRAVETVERSKSRQLVELLANADLYPKNAPAKQKQQLRELRNRLASISWLLEETATETPTPKKDTSGDLADTQRTGSASNLSRDYLEMQKQQLQAARQQLNQLLDEIKQQDPEFTLTQRVEPISFAGIRTLINSETAILDWYIGTSGFYAFIITQNTLDVVEFSKPELQQLEAWANTYLNDYRQTNRQDNLSSRLASLSQILRLDEIVAKIPPSCKELILIPHRTLHLLPLHACEVSSSRCVDLEISPCRLIDCFPAGIRYAPSCQLLQLVQRRIQESAGIPQPTENLLLNRFLFAIQNPTQDLHYTDVEVETIQRDFAPPPDTQILLKEAATKSALTQNLPALRKAEYAHFSCHGAFNFEFPLLSSLILADSLHLADTPQPPTPEKDKRQLTLRNGRKANPEKSLTLQEIFASVDLPVCRLVTLSACETGLTDATKLVDEYIGLPSGFLYAGSLSVVSSLWSVNDFATTILMIKFYEELRTESNISLALKNAQYWMRTISSKKIIEWMKNDLKLDKKSSEKIQLGLLVELGDKPLPFSDPQYWAAFCAIGK
ncbi:CHAT domain-containing protein [Microcoleus sp. FACHB-68]|uniref:CHAT domain-containing protein n=1 Tax=Microcoleus sp. FACHB-68 TaxID=2692826 RepID=UPI0016827128|nr:CHAT domain-containing protein [Microcoleus sp. FACHB-68]MBD1940380.1 CHAT domain-containing protein [Microcoleus sp. FACHB-68]